MSSHAVLTGKSCIICCLSDELYDVCRSVWAVVDGNLNEYDLRGSLLRSQTKEMLQSAGLSGVASAKWMRSTKLIIGMKDNRIAVVDTAPREAQKLVAQMYIQENNLDMADDIEPPGEEEEIRILRLINMIEVDSIADVSGPEFSSDTFTSLAYDAVDKTVLMGINGSVHRVELDGTGNGKICSNFCSRYRASLN